MPHALRPSRRELLQLASAAGLLGSCSGWLPALAQQLADHPQRRRHCVLLWMNGGPSQTDTFDMKPGHPNGGEFKEVATRVPGIRFSEHLPLLAQQADQLAILRGLNTKEGDHGRATYLMRTGHPPGGPLRYPTLGSALSKQLGDDAAELPNYVSIGAAQGFNPEAFSPGFLGPRYAAATVGQTNVFEAAPESPPDAARADNFAQLGLDFLRLPDGVSPSQADARLDLWRSLQGRFLARHSAENAASQHTVYQRALRLLRSKAAAAFDLSQEPDSVREAYGRGRFGQGCLMARRLIEVGVPFVEVALGTEPGSVGWDTHQNNFPAVQSLCRQLDAGWATLMRELRERGLLESTTVVWMGEFGRTPTINANAGRDHFPAAWTCVLGGGGIGGGQAHGATSADGREVVDGKVQVGDVLATVCQALGVDPATENTTPVGRPVMIAEGTPVAAVLS